MSEVTRRLARFIVDSRWRGVLDGSSAERLLGLCRALPTLSDAGGIARESAPQAY